MKLSDFGVPGGNRKTLVLLGAGATRGASFVQDQSLPLPPLDLDFFQQLARVGTSSAAKRLLEFVRSEYGHEVGLSMERFFSEADYTHRFHKELNVDPGPFVKRYQKALADFHEVLPRLLDDTTSSPCSYHARLASSLHTIDCVVSFNYDCTVDTALRDHAQKRWDPAKASYGFDVADGVEAWRTHEVGRMPKTTIRLLKLHGSMNWHARPDGSIDLIPDLATVRSLDGAIIPPTWFKDLTEPPFADVWKQARKEVRTARIMVVIGYSVPDTDLFSRSLLKVEAGSKEKREKLDLLVLVNPDAEARRRFIDLVRGGLETTTTILEFKSFEDLDSLLKRSSRPVGPTTDSVTFDRIDRRLDADVLAKLRREKLSSLSDRQRKLLYLAASDRTEFDLAALFGIPPDQIVEEYRSALEDLGWLEKDDSKTA